MNLCAPSTGFFSFRNNITCFCCISYCVSSFLLSYILQLFNDTGIRSIHSEWRWKVFQSLLPWFSSGLGKVWSGTSFRRKERPRSYLGGCLEHAKVLGLTQALDLFVELLEQRPALVLARPRPLRHRGHALPLVAPFVLLSGRRFNPQWKCEPGSIIYFFAGFTLTGEMFIGWPFAPSCNQVDRWAAQVSVLSMQLLNKNSYGSKTNYQ